jgi:hypothetical protein
MDDYIMGVNIIRAFCGLPPLPLTPETFMPKSEGQPASDGAEAARPDKQESPGG